MGGHTAQRPGGADGHLQRREPGPAEGQARTQQWLRPRWRPLGYGASATTREDSPAPRPCLATRDVLPGARPTCAQYSAAPLLTDVHTDVQREREESEARGQHGAPQRGRSSSGLAFRGDLEEQSPSGHPAARSAPPAVNGLPVGSLAADHRLQSAGGEP